MNKIVPTALAAAMLAATPIAMAYAATDVVVVGGTGTGYVPHNPVPSPSFYLPFVTGDVDNAVNVLYPGGPQDDTHKGVAPVREAVAAQDDPTLVVCLSKGAQVCGLAARDNGFPPGTVLVNLANPDGPSGISQAFGFSAPPVPNTIDTINVVAEYDGVGDWPDRPWNLVSSVNALIAGFTPLGPHQAFGNGSDLDPLEHLDEAEVTKVTNPNGTTTTNVFVPTKELPIMKPFKFVQDTEFTLTGDDKVYRAIEHEVKKAVDAGYARNDKPAEDKDDTEKESATKDADDEKETKNVFKKYNVEKQDKDSEKSSYGSDAPRDKDADSSADRDRGDSDASDD